MQHQSQEWIPPEQRHQFLIPPLPSLLTTPTAPGFIVGPSETHGFGVLATTNFEAALDRPTVIGRYFGTLSPFKVHPAYDVAVRPPADMWFSCAGQDEVYLTPDAHCIWGYANCQPSRDACHAFLGYFTGASAVSRFRGNKWCLAVYLEGDVGAGQELFLWLSKSFFDDWCSSQPPSSSSSSSSSDSPRCSLPQVLASPSPLCLPRLWASPSPLHKNKKENVHLL